VTIAADSDGRQRTRADHSQQLVAEIRKHERLRKFPDTEVVSGKRTAADHPQGRVAFPSVRNSVTLALPPRPSAGASRHAWNGSWNGGAENPSVLGAVVALSCGIGAGSGPKA